MIALPSSVPSRHSADIDGGYKGHIDPVIFLTAPRLPTPGQRLFFQYRALLPDGSSFSSRLFHRAKIRVATLALLRDPSVSSPLPTQKTCRDRKKRKEKPLCPNIRIWPYPWSPSL